MEQSRAAVGTQATVQPQSRSCQQKEPFEVDTDDEAFWEHVDPLTASGDEGHLEGEEVDGAADEASAQNLAPHFVDLFAGEHFPVARAMLWCGWTVKVFERGLCVDELCKDLADPDVQEEALQELRRAQASWSAIDPRTLVKTREAAVPGQPDPPRLLRGEDDLWGADCCDELDEDELALLNDHNDLLNFNFTAVETVQELNRGELVHVHVQENPKHSWLWVFEEMILPGIADDDQIGHPWTDTDYFTCEWGGVRRREHRLRSNCRLLEEAFRVPRTAGTCSHEHSASEWEPKQSRLLPGTWFHPMTAEREYPARMVWQAAVALSWDVAAAQGFRLKLPRSPALEPLREDSRVSWLTLPRGSVSWFSMGRIGLQLQMQPPTEEGHFPLVIPAAFFQTAPANAVYLGSAERPALECKRVHVNTFVATCDSAEHATLRYMKWWLEQGEDAQLATIVDLVGKILIIEAKPGESSHGYFLAAMVSQFIAAKAIRTNQEVVQLKVPYACLVPRVQSWLGNQSSSSLRGWMAHITKDDLSDTPVAWARLQMKPKSVPKASGTPPPSSGSDGGPAKALTRLAVTTSLLTGGAK